MQNEIPVTPNSQPGRTQKKLEPRDPLDRLVDEKIKATRRKSAAEAVAILDGHGEQLQQPPPVSQSQIEMTQNLANGMVTAMTNTMSHLAQSADPAKQVETTKNLVELVKTFQQPAPSATNQQSAAQYITDIVTAFKQVQSLVAEQKKETSGSLTGVPYDIHVQLQDNQHKHELEMKKFDTEILKLQQELLDQRENRKEHREDAKEQREFERQKFSAEFNLKKEQFTEENNRKAKLYENAGDFIGMMLGSIDLEKASSAIRSDEGQKAQAHDFTCTDCKKPFSWPHSAATVACPFCGAGYTISKEPFAQEQARTSTPPERSTPK